MTTVTTNYSTGWPRAAKGPAHRCLPAAGGARSPCEDGGCDEKTALGWVGRAGSGLGEGSGSGEDGAEAGSPGQVRGELRQSGRRTLCWVWTEDSPALCSEADSAPLRTRGAWPLPRGSSGHHTGPQVEGSLPSSPAGHLWSPRWPAGPLEPSAPGMCPRGAAAVWAAVAAC